MKLIGRILLVVVALIIIVAGTVAAIGYFLPVEHLAARRVVLPAPRDSVWKTITDVASYPSWRSDVNKVDVVASPNGRIAWREESGGDVLPMEIVNSSPPSSLQVRIASDSLPFGGTWTYLLRPAGQGTALTIIENGSVYNPIFRFMSRYVIGHNRTIDSYLRSLGKKYGADVVPGPAVDTVSVG